MQNRSDYKRPIRHHSVGMRKVKNVLAKIGLQDELKNAFLALLLPKKQTNKSQKRKPPKLTGKVRNAIIRVLVADGHCGLTYTKSGKVIVSSGKHTKITTFNFQRKNIHEKAIQNRMGNMTTSENKVEAI